VACEGAGSSRLVLVLTVMILARGGLIAGAAADGSA